jgi:GNAT superfamily N-acetyltransferase
MTPAATAPAAVVTCARMSAATRAAAQTLLGEFLQGDAHYRASSAVYGDSGPGALERALGLFSDRPELGFVWLAFAEQDGAHVPAGACVVCRAISTSRGAVVAKLDDVTIARRWQGHGVGGAMLGALCEALRAEGIARLDTACHRDNERAWRFYARLGFRPLDEERIALLL